MAQNGVSSDDVPFIKYSLGYMLLYIINNLFAIKSRIGSSTYLLLTCIRIINGENIKHLNGRGL